MSKIRCAGVSFVIVVIVVAGIAAQRTTRVVEAPPAGIDLVVHINGFTHVRGHAMARVFVAGQSLTGPGQATGRADIYGSQATITFPSLAPGEYAVIAAHDENDNGEVDHGMFGPSEPIGFSNGFRLWRLPLSFPTFKKLKFVLAPDRNRIEVTVR
jgi:uncharacterized protein (DUF2141 family)